MAVTSAVYKWEANVVYRICIVYTECKITWVMEFCIHGHDVYSPPSSSFSCQCFLHNMDCIAIFLHMLVLWLFVHMLYCCVTLSHTGYYHCATIYIDIRWCYILMSGSQVYACCVHAVYVVHVYNYVCIHAYKVTCT